MGSEPCQQFCLKWTNFQSSLLTSLPQLLDGDDLTDVTLIAEGSSIKAHRVVLSACSSFFRDLFRSLQPSHHPVVALPTLPFTDLKALVTFMYRGEVNIFEDQLTSLLGTAEVLKIRGLSEVPKRDAKQSMTQLDKESDSSSLDTPIPASEAAEAEPSVKRTKTTHQTAKKSLKSLSKLPREKVEPAVHVDQDTLEQEIDLETLEDPSLNILVKEEVLPKPNPEENHEEILQKTEMDADMDVSVDAATSTPTSSQPQRRKQMTAFCPVCGKQLSNMYNLRVHMEIHQNRIYACCYCSHLSRSRDALRKHMAYRHGKVKEPPAPSP